MQIGMVGLGRMGGNMTRRLMRAGHECVVYNKDPGPIETLSGEGAVPSRSLEELASKLDAPRTVWLMIPAGAPTESTVRALAGILSEGDVVIDGGNSFFKDDVRRGIQLAESGIDYVDVGTSGGVWGLERGYCLMIGGKEEVVARLDPIFRALAPGRGGAERTPGRAERGIGTAEEGYVRVGPIGSGHFVKMVHNGIEYGIMQAMAEGFDLMRNADRLDLEGGTSFDLDLADVSEVWRRGSVISSWLLDLAAAALFEDRHLEEFSGAVPDSGEGRWTVQTAIETAVSADVLASSVFARFRSRRDATFGEKLLSALRRQFGGHSEAGGGS
ncbi:MAG: decarboxylating 6-phosphogluconate dehydrogenase [Candidatus Eisenbacteria bacterium]|nr:decarboxylating 6-phosphogluconate dehydrogenase [Candidatus Latescibacterota bacterium]MBD3301160.1 decarboxylating 6-phosphogluconate dehydrogenase [Candidatus Eisenbacteria bacterium]